ncbi:MAG: hypothetical protein EHM12_08145 [Dehalococcoidia bacterium]|nr:MAG: hypothetical protein EHM12_08145 [Dehalococcoidia bacterium]
MSYYNECQRLQEEISNDLLQSLSIGIKGIEKSLNIYYLSDYLEQEKIEELNEMKERLECILNKYFGNKR